MESLRLTVGDVAYGGDGVARAEGRVVFVPFTIPGEEVTVRLGKRKKHFAEAALLAVETPSNDRVEPRCPYFTRCGGCRYQHIEYGRQLAIKSAQVEQTLRRIGRLAEVPMRPIVPSPLPYGYRSRIRVHVEGGSIGFYGFGSREIVDIESCPISSDAVNETLRAFRSGPAPEEGDHTLREPGRAEFFEQTNAGVAAAMLEVLEGLVLRGQLLLIDAYCGGGFFAKRLRPLFDRVIGIEAHPSAVDRARRDAAPGETYVSGDVGLRLGAILAQSDLARTTLILDPPAAGLPRAVIDLLLASPPAEVLYVSCDAATMARDLALLSAVYALDSVTPLDMFPQTADIEVIARLRSGARGDTEPGSG